MAAELTWAPGADDAFVNLKGALHLAPALGILATIRNGSR